MAMWPDMREDSPESSPEDESLHLISEFEKHRDSAELPAQMYDFLRSYTEQNKFDCVLKVLREFPEFRASRAFIYFDFTPILLAAAKAGHLAFIRFMIEEWSVHVDVETEKDNLFAVACFNEHYDIMKFVFDIYGIYSTQEQLLIFAIKHGHIDIVRYLHEIVGVEVLVQKEKAIASAFKSCSVEMLEYCYYTLDLTTITSMKTAEAAIFAAAESGDFALLQVLTDLFTVTLVLNILPNRYMQKKCHFFHALQIMIRKRDIRMVQFCVEVLKVPLATTDANSELAQYLDLLGLCVENGDADMLLYLVQSVGMSVSLFYQISQAPLSELVEKDWPDDENKEQILEWIEQAERTQERSDSEDLPAKRPRTNSA